MNMKWVIIGTILVVLLVAFGNNPVRDAREERRKEIDEKGILVYEIEKHLEEKKAPYGMPSGVGAGPGPMRIPGSALPPDSRVPQGAVPAQPIAPATPADIPQPTQPQGYYPPSPQPENTIPTYDPTAPRSEQKSDIKRLADGITLEYSGTKVFAKTPEGESMRMPDGKYLIDGGRFLMIVRGGERMDIMAYAAP